VIKVYNGELSTGVEGFADMSSPVITVSEISKSFGSVKAVDDLSFAVNGGTCFGFLGPNGAGKTTLMKMLYGMCVPDKGCGGTMDVLGYDPVESVLSIKYLSGVVPQENNLDEELNVIQNLMIYSRFYDMTGGAAKERIGILLEFLQLGDKRRARIKELSGGMKRRLVIARALLNNPRLLILDEPTTGLDPQVRHLIWDKLRRLKKQDTTILLTTHYMEEASQLCDRLVIMDKGKKIMEGEPFGLVEANIEKYVLEIIDVDSGERVHQAALPDKVRVDLSDNAVRLYCDQAGPLRRLADCAGNGRYLLRQTNLEDVFLKSTGRGLNEAQ